MCLGSFASFETIEEVIARANNSLYGLAAGVWSSNINTCMTTSLPLSLTVCLSTSLCLSACLSLSLSLSVSLTLMLGGVGMTVAENIDAGTVWVNGMMSSWGYQVSLSLGSLSLSIYLSISVCVSYTTIGYQAPFGGPKQTGGGRTNGKQGLDEYLITKTVSINLNN